MHKVKAPLKNCCRIFSKNLFTENIYHKKRSENSIVVYKVLKCPIMLTHLHLSISTNTIAKKKSFFPISCSFFSICKEFVVIMNHFNWNGGIPKMGSSFNYNDENFWIHSKKHSNKKEFLR